MLTENDIFKLSKVIDKYVTDTGMKNLCLSMLEVERKSVKFKTDDGVKKPVKKKSGKKK